MTINFIMFFSEKLDKIKLQHVPTELKKELERELETLRSENQRIKLAYEAMEIEKSKWRDDGSKDKELMSKISALKIENEDLRRSVTRNI